MEEQLGRMLEAGNFDGIASYLGSQEIEVCGGGAVLATQQSRLIQRMQLIQLLELVIHKLLWESVDKDPYYSQRVEDCLLSMLSSGEEARFLYKRFPESVKEKSEVAAAWHVCKVLWNQCYEAYWPALHGYQWSPEVRRVVKSLECAMRQRMLNLIQSAYSNISLPKFASFLGLSHEEALQKAQEEGWERQGDLLKVSRKVPKQMSKNGERNLQQLTEYVVRLEG